jgi:hypothetical protein
MNRNTEPRLWRGSVECGVWSVECGVIEVLLRKTIYYKKTIQECFY